MVVLLEQVFALIEFDKQFGVAGIVYQSAKHFFFFGHILGVLFVMHQNSKKYAIMGCSCIGIGMVVGISIG